MKLAFVPLYCLVASTSLAAPLEQIDVLGRQVNLVGSATSASEGRISQEELQLRPLLRTGDILESVPGLVATQHSGNGKANQFFLRGFNLDHGTDFATSVDGMPVNMRTHGHGQGYSDLNFLIPELIEEITFRKGSYYKDVGDFSATGAAGIRTAGQLQQDTLSLSAGQFGFTRALLSGTTALHTGDFTYALEAQGYTGPWDQIDEDVAKTNLWLKYLQEDGDNRWSLMYMGYDNRWNSADQIPERAVQQGLISDYGSIDTDVGGNSSRQSLSLDLHRSLGAGSLQANAWLIGYDMQLWSNFTYNTTPQGDQFEQVDRRLVYGGELAWQLPFAQKGLAGNNRYGVQLRVDDIDEVGLLNTQARTRIGTTRLDRVEEGSVGLFWQNTLQWTPRLRSITGLRTDRYDFDVTALAAGDPATLAANSGRADDSIVTGSLSLVYTFSDAIELYASIGQGFHSNDARGTTITLDPLTATPVDRVDPLVDTLGSELGARIFLTDRWNASVALWQLAIDSELLFVGDAGNTEDTGVGSQRHGVELTSYYQLSEQVSLDLEYAWTDSRFDIPQGGSRDIPGALEHVLSGGFSVNLDEGWQANLRLRHFNDYPLDGGFRADSSTLLNLRLGWQPHLRVALTLDMLNLLDGRDRDIQYAYASQLPGESEPVDDRHYHVFEPRSLRLYANYYFR